MSINSFFLNFLFSDKMNSRKMILSGAILAMIAVLTVAVQPAIAGEENIGGGPGNFPPQVYLLKKAFDICNPSGLIPGGSMPPSGQQEGCVVVADELRMNEYAFTGEQIAELVAVRDLNGDIDILKADLMVDGSAVVKCNDITQEFVAYAIAHNHPDEDAATGYQSDDKIVNAWFGHDIELNQIPAKSAGTITGLDTRFDKLYECILTVTPSMSGKSEVLVTAWDQADETGDSPLQMWWFNPAIVLDVSTSDGGPIAFEDGASPGQMVYSTNSLFVENDAEGGVDLYAWIAATDLVDTSGAAKCPLSNVLESDQMEYRCKIGTLFNDPWTELTNPDDSKPCTFAGTCQNAKPLLPNLAVGSFILNGHTAECWFRITYPVPCVGTFDEGQVLLYVRAV
jgi:hypothetical protein